tara:strand:+ start:261 stop:470 length:210 start_codon:yes stop_codon:yes gene_type:complete
MMLRLFGILSLSLLLIDNANAVCDTKAKKEERENQKALKLMGYSGSILDPKTGKYVEYDVKNCNWKKTK